MPIRFNSKELKKISAKVIAGKATPEEINFLNAYYDVFDKNQNVSEELSAEDKITLRNEILSGISDRTDVSKKHQKYTYLLKIAASLILLTAAGYFAFHTFHESSYKTIAATGATKDVLPGGNNATLTLADGSKYILNEINEETLFEKGNIKIFKIKEGQLKITMTDKAVSAQKPSINTISTPRGGKYEVILADGSKILLNSASVLKFPDSFNGDTREVHLEGEAYFEIKHITSKPFLVKSGNTIVNVLGTHFNVMAYDTKQIKTTLLQGSVNVKNDFTSATLIPGEQATMSQNGMIDKRKVDADKETSWRNGWFNFSDSSIEDVMNQISRWYNVDVAYKGKMPQKEIMGRISRNVKLSVVLEMLEYSGLKFDINDKKITVKNQL